MVKPKTVTLNQRLCPGITDSLMSPSPYPGTFGSTSHYSTLVTVPDSITTWQFVAVSVKAGQGDPMSPALKEQENSGPGQPQGSWPPLNVKRSPGSRSLRL